MRMGEKEEAILSKAMSIGALKCLEELWLGGCTALDMVFWELTRCSCPELRRLMLEGVMVEDMVLMKNVAALVRALHSLSQGKLQAFGLIKCHILADYELQQVVQALCDCEGLRSFHTSSLM